MAVLHCHCMGYYSNPLCHHEGEDSVTLSLKPQDVWQTRIIECQRRDHPPL